MSRIDRTVRTWDVTNTLANGVPASIPGVDIALLAPRTSPTAAMAASWVASTYSSVTGKATILLAGPEADSTGALVVPATADLWMRVTDAPEVEAVFVERITVLGAGGSIPALPSTYVTSWNGRSGPVVGTYGDVGAAPYPTGGSDGQALLKSGTSALWGTVSGGASLPTQTGNNGKYLTTDGTAASWGTVPAGYTDEQAQDAAAALIAAGTHLGISFSYNDAGNALSATAAVRTVNGISPVSGNVTVPTAVVTLGVKRDYGAVGDMRVVTDAACTGASTTLTSATAAFVSGDVGKTIAIQYAGADNGTQTIGRTFITTIASVTNSTTVVLTAAPTKTIVAPRTVTDAAVSTGGTLTSATANFTATDVGKKITIPNGYYTQANSGGAPKTVKITAFTNSTTVTISHKPVSSVSSQTITIPGAWVGLGTDDTTAMQNAVTAASTQKKVLEIEPGRYLITAELTVASNCSIFGHGAGISIISQVASTLISAFTYQGASTTAATISDVTFYGFEIDGNGVRAATYDTTGKGIFIRPVRRLRVDRMYIHDTGSTALGCDWCPDSIFTNNIIDWGGSQVWDFVSGGGGSGIGLGTGLFSHEPVTITGNIVTNCGNNGIFTEAQSNNVQSRGVRIVGNYAAFCGGSGVSDRACDGTIIEGNVVVCCGSSQALQAGISISGGFVAGLYSINSSVRGNTLIRCCIDVEFKDGDCEVTDNMIVGPLVGGTFGIGFSERASSGGSRTNLVIDRNTVSLVGGRGIQIQNGVHGRIFIRDNISYNNGVNTSTRRPGIDVTATSALAMYVKGNVAYDTRALASKTQSYGLSVTSGTYTYFEHWGNDFQGNQDGTVLTTGATITTEVTTPNTY